jgi:hypothetical protein
MTCMSAVRNRHFQFLLGTKKRTIANEWIFCCFVHGRYDLDTSLLFSNSVIKMFILVSAWKLHVYKVESLPL